MLYLPIWQENMVPKYKEGWGGTRGNTPEMDILTAGEEIVPKILHILVPYFLPNFGAKIGKYNIFPQT